MDKERDVAEMLDENVPVNQEQETPQEEASEETCSV